MNGRSVWAVVAGVLFVIVVTTIVDMATGMYPWQVLLAIAYRFVIGVAGGWLAAKLAPQNPVKHAMALGYVGTVLGLVGIIATWTISMGPHPYAIALAAFAIPQSWLGGKLFEMGKKNGIAGRSG